MKVDQHKAWSPRIHLDLFDEGIRVGCKRIDRLMRLAGRKGVSRRKGCRTTIPRRRGLRVIHWYP